MLQDQGFKGLPRFGGVEVQGPGVLEVKNIAIGVGGVEPVVCGQPAVGGSGGCLVRGTVPGGHGHGGDDGVAAVRHPEGGVDIIVRRGIAQGVVRLMREKVDEMALAQVQVFGGGGQKTAAQPVEFRRADGCHGPADVPAALSAHGGEAPLLQPGVVPGGGAVRRGGGVHVLRCGQTAGAREGVARSQVDDGGLAVFGGLAQDEEIVRRGGLCSVSQDGNAAQQRRQKQHGKEPFQLHIVTPGRDGFVINRNILKKACQPTPAGRLQ